MSNSLSPLQAYLKNTASDSLSTAMIAYLSNLEQVAKVSPEIASSIVKEFEAQRTHLKLIASENYCSLSVQAAMGNLLTDKYAEGYPEHRYYGGCENIDAIESLAAEEAKALFGAEHAYVQPHSGADANLVAYWAILNTKIEMPALESLGETNVSNLSDADWKALREKLGNQKMLGLDYSSGGHLTHGYRQNISARMFETYSYTVEKDTGVFDYDKIEALAMEIKPL
ncbi:MAG TPA: glycine hydroxymethyltransferase, partial [Treponema sp.]|nr:glycine hydroxymethyltransferase [Treponema sp.]